jgi:hypothetical protein
MNRFPSPIAAVALAAVILLSIAPGRATAQDSEPADQPAPKWDLEFDFRLDGLMFCDVTVGDDERVWNFMIDSGATSSVLASRTAEMLGIKTSDLPAGAARGVGTQDVKMATGVELNVAGHTFKAGMALVTDLSKIADMSGYYMDGIIGSDWLMQWGECHFDFVASKAQFRRPADGKARRSIQDIVSGMMEGMGGGLPGLPGFPPGRDREPEREPERKPDPDRPLPPGRGEDFSFTTAPSVISPLVASRSLSSVMTGQMAGDLESMEVDFKMSEARIPLVQGSIVLVNLWFVEMAVEGKPVTMIFDTGAAPLLVLDRATADGMDLGTSFTVPVTGLGEADATMGIVNNFRFGGHRERREVPAVVMDLSETFGQFAEVKNMLGPIGQFLNISLPTPHGLMGLPFALRYRSMTVDYNRMKLVFTKYTADDLDNPETLPAPTQDDAVIIDAVKKTWAGNGGSFGLNGKSLKFETWKSHGLDGGIVVETVVEGGAADRAGIKPGDVLALLSTKAMGEAAKALAEESKSESDQLPEWIPVRAMSSANSIAAWLGAGTSVEVQVWRASEEGGKDEDGKLNGKLHLRELKLDGITEGVVVPKRYQPKKAE